MTQKLVNSHPRGWHAPGTCCALAFGHSTEAVPFAKRVSLCYGARSAAYLASFDSFAARDVEVYIATEDALLGHCGSVTDVLHHLLDNSSVGVRIACCGTEPIARQAMRGGRQPIGNFITRSQNT
ncbi:MAG: hypothetical protein ACK5AC_15720 [Planctomycetota bacterium]|jgi:NAD(P)H-flavin reductase